jgi:phosphoesterase RecJ-like protein
MKVKECAEFLKKLDKVHIYTHIHPDGDAIGSSFALAYILKKMGKSVQVICLDTLPSYLSFIWDTENDGFDGEFTVTVDVADRALLGDFGEKKIDLVIDHHEKNRIECENKLCIPEMAATGEIIYEIMKELSVEPDRYIAECLYTAIATDTGCFKFSNAKEHTFSTVADLVKYTPEGSFGYLNEPLFITKSINKLRFESEVISNLSFHFKSKVSVSVITNDLISKHSLTDGDVGGVEQLGKAIEGVKLAITLKERDDGFKISMRSSNDINCSEICSHFGGGGHRGASGCFMAGEPKEIIETLLRYIEEKVTL